MKQQTLAMATDQGFEQHRKSTRRDVFLDTMHQIVPWPALCAIIEPHYPKKGNGRPPIGLERMLRIHFLQHWFNLADFACEEALYDSASLRRLPASTWDAKRYRMPPPCSSSVTCWKKRSWANNCLPRSGASCKTAA